MDVTTDIKAWKGSNWTIESHETSRCCRDKNSEHPDEQVKVELRGRSPLPLWAPASWLYETMTIITWEPNQTRNKLTLCLNVFNNILKWNFPFDYILSTVPFVYPPFWIFTQVTAVHCSLFHVPRFPVILFFSNVFPWLTTTYLFKYKTQHLSYFKITVT